MFSRWSIKKKLLLCLALIALVALTMSISSLVGVYAYRDVVRTISFRAAELPLSHGLTRSVERLATTFQRVRHERTEPPTLTPRAELMLGISAGMDALNRNRPRYNSVALREEFRINFSGVEEQVRRYRDQLEQVEPGTGISDNRIELAAVGRLEETLAQIASLNTEHDWVFDRVDIDQLGSAVERLQTLAEELPSHLQRNMQDLKGNARGQYRTLIAVAWVTSILCASAMLWLAKFFYDAIAGPLRTVVRGSRRVAAGDFDHRIELKTNDEMAELAAGLNAMTTRFKQIRDDLDRQVREQTKEVVRGEQLASVGFLAAGVAHEINNPLQSISMCAEALHDRLGDMIAADDELPDGDHNPEITILRRYLRRIQDEAFRCKDITTKLLSYSRLGDAERTETDLSAAVTDVIDLIETLGRYRAHRIDFVPPEPILARVVAPEIKQVLLNVIVNALDSLNGDGVVTIELRRVGNSAELIVRDNGCGMSEDVKRHLFEPFFTRRRDGQGTGLGLSITYRIVQDHGGTITADSDGPGRGSQFRISLPLNGHEERTETRQAA